MSPSRSHLSRNQKLTLSIAVVGILVTLVSAFIVGHDWFSTKSPNLLEKPIIAQISAKSIAGGELLKSNGSLTICRNQIQFFNSSNTPTSVISISMDIYIDGEKLNFHESDQPLVAQVNNTAVVVSVWGQNPPDITEYVNAKSFDDAISLLGERLPVQVKEHTTANIFVDIIVDGGSIKPQNISSNYTIEFPDIDPIVFPQIDCLGL
jgi:hypothetical protein